MAKEDPKEKLAALEAENESLKAGKLPKATEDAVRERVRLGLDRAQALEAVRAQEAWDKDPANPNNAKKG